MQDKKPSLSRRKVGFIITKGVWGGAQKYVYTLATSLPKDRYDVFVVCGEGNILKEKLQEKNVRVYVVENLKRDISVIAEIKSSWKLLQIVWQERPDVLHLNSPKAAGFGAVAGRLRLTPKIIQTIHGWTFNEERNIFSYLLIRFFSWITMLLCHKTIIIAKSEKKQALEMPMINSKKIVLIKNGIEPIKYIEKSIVQEALMSRTLKYKAQATTDTIWLGTTAELNRNKGLEYAIKAVSKIKTPYVYFIIGEGEERKNLENLIRQSGLENKVFLLGFVENANLYLKAFDIFLLTSEKEGLPYTILEAGQAGLPVLASAVGGIPEIIDDGENGILTRKGDISQITKGLDYFISKPKERKSFGTKLQKKIEKEFSLEEMIKKTITLYR